MSQVYVEISCQVTPVYPWSDLLIAELGAEGYESFVNTDIGFLAYISANYFDPKRTQSLLQIYQDQCEVSFTTTEIVATNWNAEWEKNFSPIIVGDRIYVRAPFHPAKASEYEIIIEPKMSFGTGHHQTTYLMLEYLLKLELTDLNVLDMGSGTAILAIMACKRGAKTATAIDIDTWCGENALENAHRNGIENIEVLVGTAKKLPKQPCFDLILANINRNILIQDIPAYVACLHSGGTVLLSGFYLEDLTAIKEACEASGLIYVEHISMDLWVAVKFIFL